MKKTNNQSLKINFSNFLRDTRYIRFLRSLNYFLLIHPFKGSSRLRKAISKLMMYVSKGPTMISTKYNFDIICMDPSHDKGVEKPLFLDGTYEAGTLDIIKKCLKKSDIFIDIGANIGLMSIFASKVLGNKGFVYSFEPEPETFMILKKNIEINLIKNIRIYNIGFGEKRNKSHIYTNPYAGRGSASLIKPLNQNNSKRYEIQIETLDNFILEHDVTDVKMSKIDVEGWELQVLKGAKNFLRSAKAPIICIEYSKMQSSDEQLLDIYSYILSINNYNIYKLERGKGIPSKLIKITNSKDLPYHDNLFCFLPMHLKDIPKNIFL